MENRKQPLIGLDRAELAALFSDRKDAKIRSNQIAHHIYGRAEADFSKMLDLPKEFRELLEEKYQVSPLHVATHRKSTDGVEKLLVHNGDNQVYECVLLPYKDRVSCSISSQVGCPMGCTFCATG